MMNSNILPVIATPVANSNNEALLVPTAAVGVKPKAKVKRAAEMSRIACFNEITRTAHRTFVKNTPRKICSLLREDQLVQLKRDAISEAIVKYQAKHGGDYDLKAYKKDFFKRVILLMYNPIFIEWVKEHISAYFKASYVAQHIVFNGAEFFERVMMNDYLEDGDLQIGWHRDYNTPIFTSSAIEGVASGVVQCLKPTRELIKSVFEEVANPKTSEAEDEQNPETQEDNAPKAPKADVKQKDDVA